MRYINRIYEYIDSEATFRIQEQTGCSQIMAELLLARGIKSLEQYRLFIEAPLPTDDDPFQLSDMCIAVETIRQSIEMNKRICIYGDYDVDGVCATVILYKTLGAYTKNLRWYIPSRLNEGYGMHASSIKELAEDGVELLITVDNGISAIKEVELAKSLGIETVITDHHRFSNELPNAVAIVASSRNDYALSVNDLSGAGIAWMLARAITGQDLDEFLPYVALAAAADSVKVTKHNRPYIKNSFPLFMQDKHFKTMLKNAGMLEKTISMYTLNYIFAPRINAAGRMAHADIAVRFFLSEDAEEINELGGILEKLNQDRKAEENRIYSECIKKGGTERDVLVFWGDDWNVGVVGIVASRLTETFHKNVFVLGKTGNEEYIGSGRSDSYTDLYFLLLSCADILERFGGHSGAAGITISQRNLCAFCDAINSSFKVIYPNGIPRQYSEYDVETDTSTCSTSLVKEINGLAPFGPGNPEPIFRFSNSIISDVALIGKGGEHLSARINNSHSDRNNSMRIVSFRSSEKYDFWRSQGSADILATLSINTYRGIDRCEAKCIAINKGVFDSEGSDFIELVNAFLNQLRYNNMDMGTLARRVCIILDNPSIDELRLRELYVFLRHRYSGNIGKNEFISTGTAEEIGALLVFIELGLATVSESIVTFLSPKQKADCHNSILFHYFNNEFGGSNNGTQQIDQKHS